MAVVALTAASWSAAAGQQPACATSAPQQVFDLVNAARSSQGLAPLMVDLRLARAAQAHARDMADGRFMSHAGSDGSDPGDRADRAGYPWRRVTENVASGYPEPAFVVPGWMNSPDHRRNILDPEVRHAGVGYALREGDQRAHYWVMVYGDSAQPPDVGTGCHP